MKEVLFEGNRYTISFDAMLDSLKQSLLDDQLQLYLKLLGQVQVKPKDVYQEIKTFCAKHAEIPEVINLLTFAHIQNYRVTEAEKLIETTYQKHPEYFFSKINYADQCIRKKQLDKVTEIFSSFDLQELYPGKETYHTSEFRGFLIMMTYYHLALKDKEKALDYYYVAKEIEPNNPNVLYLEKKLFKKQLLRRFFNSKK